MKPPPAPGLVNRVIALTLLLLIFTGTLGLGAVWMRQEISQTANQTRALEEKLTGVGRRLDEVNAKVAEAVNPNALLLQAKFMNLALTAPREIQVVRVTGSAELKLAAKRNREAFSLETAPAGSATPNSDFRVVTASLR
jgi:hypothetical protein